MPILYESLGEAVEDSVEITIELPTPEGISWKTAALVIVPASLLFFLVKLPKTSSDAKKRR